MTQGSNGRATAGDHPERPGAVEPVVPAGPPAERAAAPLPVLPAPVAVRGPIRLGLAALHPLLVTLPIGAFACTLAFDVASRSAEGYVFARGAMWLSIIGLVGMVLAGAVGMADARRRAHPATPAQRMAARHLLLNAGAFVAFGGALWVRRTSLDDLVSGSPTPAIVLTAVGSLLVLGAAILGGDLATTLDRDAAATSD